jgi:hypothetical protein
MCSTSVIFEALPEESNHPKDENSPNLVTLTEILLENNREEGEKFADISLSILSMRVYHHYKLIHPR